MNYYIRIGELPQDGKSKIYQWKDKAHTLRTVVGEEAGVSVYEAAKVGNEWHCIIPENAEHGKSTIDTIHYLTEEIINGNKPVYLVTGDEVGKGYDGEPVITNVKIIEDISDDFKKRCRRFFKE